MKKIFFFLFLITSTQSFAQNNLAKISTKTEIISPKQFLANGFADTVEELLPAVVNISATQEIQSGNSAIDLLGDLPKSPLLDDFRNQLENQFRGQQGQKKKVSSIGSGFVISKDGSIVTNAHVVEDADEITISLNDGTKYKAKIIGIDKRTIPHLRDIHFCIRPKLA